MHDLELVFLGTGTSHGIPVIGCQCRVCQSKDPRDKRLRTAALLRSPAAIVQIDTPPDFRTQCLREGLTRIDAVVYTHSHTDHILGFDDLRRFCEMENKDMPIYGSPRTLADLKRVFAFAFDGQHRYANYIRPLPIEIRGPFAIGNLQWVPVELPHGRMITTGFVVWAGGRKRLAYFTDCQEVPPAAEEAARGVELLVIGALRHAAHSTHLTLRGALEAVERIQPARALFVHMCHDLGHAETEATLPEGVRLAYDGLRVAV